MEAPQGDELPGETTPRAQTSCSFSEKATPGAPVKNPDGYRRCKAKNKAIQAALLEFLVKTKAELEQADIKAAEASEKYRVSMLEESRVKQEHANAKENFNNANNEVQEAEVEMQKKNNRHTREMYKGACSKFKDASARLESASEAVLAASEKIAIAKDTRDDAEQEAAAIRDVLHSMKWKDEEWAVEDTSNVEEDQLSLTYSKFRSYAKDKHPHYPIRVWTMTELQLSRFGTRYIIPKNLTRDEAKDKIETILQRSAARIKGRGFFWFDIPIRKRDFLDYCPSLAMPLLRRGHVAKRSFKDGRTRHTACITAWVLHRLYEVLSGNTTTTLRAIYYSAKKMFRNPEAAGEALADICCMLECTSLSVGVVPRQKGTVIGNVLLHMADEPDLNCLPGVFIPYDVRKIRLVVMDKSVKSILVIEKGTMWDRLVQSNFHHIQSCVIVCGYGQPDERTRRFIRILEEKTSVQIYGLTDPDPWGLSIVKTYAKGSDHLVHSNIAFAVSLIHWIGITTLDIQTLEYSATIELLKDCPKLTPRERQMLNNLKSSKYNLSSWWIEQIDHMLLKNKKACFEDLDVFDPDYVTERFIPCLMQRVDDDIGGVSNPLITSSCICPPLDKIKFDELNRKTNNFGNEALLDGNLYRATLDSVMVLKKMTLSHSEHNDFIKHVRSGHRPNLTQRLEIAHDVARGLEFLHSRGIHHGAIKSTKVLLFDNYRAKIADFNFRKSPELSTYDAPENENDNTERSDVFSFGVVLLELFSGKNPPEYDVGVHGFVSWATSRLEEKKNWRIEYVDPSLGGYPEKVVEKYAGLVVWCLKLNVELRPNMADVVSELSSLLDMVMESPAV